jgi:hypothetical protein
MSQKNGDLQVLVPPLPAAALVAKAATGQSSVLEQQVADLRAMVLRLGEELKLVREIAGQNLTVCTACGKWDCHEAPHVPLRFFMRYGPRHSFDEYRRFDPEGARRSEWEYMRFRRSGYYRDEQFAPRELGPGLW